MTRSPRRVFIRTFGCQMNKLDSELALESLLMAGYERADSLDDADVILFNTCSVRQHAEDKVYSHVGALKRRKRRDPNLIIGIVGCMAEKEGERLFARAGHVDLVCGPQHMAELPRLVQECAAGGARVLAVGAGQTALDRPRRLRAAPHAFLAIIRGCNNFCSYCVVPYLRGRERSRPLDEVVDEAKRLADAGAKEITLLGQNVNSYGNDLDERIDFADLLAAVNDVPGLVRIRFVTNHPKDMSDRTIEAIASLDKVCEHVHMPAQAGSDRILKRMRRGYTAAHYRGLLRKLKERVPGVGVASDFIVGFPGETDEDFQQTARLVEDARFHGCFVFKYSPRPGTAAAKLDDDVPDEVKRERNQTLLKIQERIQAEEHKKLIGRAVEVLVEGPSKNDPDKWTGRTRDNRIVIFPRGGLNAGDLAQIRIETCTPLTLFGRPV